LVQNIENSTKIFDQRTACHEYCIAEVGLACFGLGPDSFKNIFDNFNHPIPKKHWHWSD